MRFVHCSWVMRNLQVTIPVLEDAEPSEVWPEIVTCKVRHHISVCNTSQARDSSTSGGSDAKYSRCLESMRTPGGDAVGLVHDKAPQRARQVALVQHTHQRIAGCHLIPSPASEHTLNSHTMGRAVQLWT